MLRRVTCGVSVYNLYICMFRLGTLRIYICCVAVHYVYIYVVRNVQQHVPRRNIYIHVNVPRIYMYVPSQYIHCVYMLCIYVV